MYIFKGNSRYRRYGLKIGDFIWVDINKLHLPWYPMYEMDKTVKSKELCPVTAELMKSSSGVVDTSLLNSPHVELLRLYNLYKSEIFNMEFLRTTRYYKMHRGWRERGINASVRTDDWILNKKVKNFIRIYLNIKENGYSYEAKNKSFISILREPLARKYGYKREIDGYELFDGGHRAACLYILKYRHIKVLVLK